MRPLSDFAATSAVPQFALITLMLPEQTDVAWVKQLYQGLRRAADRFRREHSRRRNEQHARADCHFDERHWIR